MHGESAALKGFARAVRDGCGDRCYDRSFWDGCVADCLT